MSTFSETVGAGELRASLVALRDLLAKRLEDCEPRETAAIARQLTDVLARIEALPGGARSELDELLERRKSKIS